MMAETRAAQWTVPHDHAAFAGHFPGRPIVPGVVLLDQAMRLVAEAEPRLRLAGLASAKFLNPAGPGETLAFSWTAGATGVRFDIAAGERRIATGVFSVGERA